MTLRRLINPPPRSPRSIINYCELLRAIGFLLLRRSDTKRRVKRAGGEVQTVGFEQQKAPLPFFFLFLSRPLTEPSIHLLSRHHIDFPSLPPSIIRTRLSVSLAGVCLPLRSVSLFLSNAPPSRFFSPPLFIPALSLGLLLTSRFFFSSSSS